jgi:hypothetical protein
MLLPLPLILAKSVFQLAVADESWRIIETHASPAPSSSAGLPIGMCPGHHGSLRLRPPLGALAQWPGHRSALLPAQYVRAYVKRNKTDAADAAACSKPPGRPTCARCASSLSSSKPCKACTASAACGWAPAPAASTPCAASAGSSVSPSPWVRAPASRPSAGFWPTRPPQCRT